MVPCDLRLFHIHTLIKCSLFFIPIIIFQFSTFVWLHDFVELNIIWNWLRINQIIKKNIRKISSLMIYYATYFINYIFLLFNLNNTIWIIIHLIWIFNWNNKCKMVLPGISDSHKPWNIFMNSYMIHSLPIWLLIINTCLFLEASAFLTKLPPL